MLLQLQFKLCVQQCSILPVCAESIKYHQSQTVCVSKSTVTCNNTDIPDSYLNHKHKPVNFVFLKFVHILHTLAEEDYGCEEEMSSCGRFEENEIQRQKEEDTENLQKVFLGHIPTPKTSLSVIQEQPLYCSHHHCACPEHTASSECGLSPTVLSSTVAETPSQQS